MNNLVMSLKKERMRKPEYLITNLKIVDSIENLSLVTFEFRVLTSFLAMVFFAKTSYISSKFNDFDILCLTLNRIWEFK